MDPRGNRPQPLRYRGFISFAHEDRDVASRLHRSLERYRLPKGIEAPVKKDRRLGRFFIDKDELGAAASLDASIKGALDETETLIVVASPAAVASEWVSAEIAHFGRHETRLILSLIRRGTPNAHDPKHEAFPKELRSRTNMQQPLAADLSKDSFRRAFLKLVAGLLSIPFDDLWKRDLRRRRSQRMLLGTGLAAIIIAGVITAGLQQIRLDTQELLTSSYTRSQDGWLNAWRPEFFGPAFRSAAAAVRLDGNGGLTECDMARPGDRPVCALASSGHVLPSRLIYGTMPEREQDNVRSDIEDASAYERRMLTARFHVRDLAISADPIRIAAVTNEPRLLLIEPSGEILLDRRLEYPSEVVAISDDGERILLNGGTDALLHIDVATLEDQYVDLTHGQINHVGALPSGWFIQFDGRSFARLSNDLTVSETVPTVETDVYNLAPLSPKRNMLAVLESYGGRGLIEMQNIESTNGTILVENAVIGRGIGQVKALAIDSNGRWIALGGSGDGAESGVQIIAAGSGDEISRLRVLTNEVTAIRFVPTTSLFIVGGSDFALRIGSVETGVEHARLIGHVAPVQDFEISADGRLMVSAAWDGTIRMWNLPDYWAINGEGLLNVRCTQESDLVSSMFPSSERISAAVTRRPEDACAWRANGISGWVQTLGRLVNF